jgi:hypothetical protein
LPGIRLGLDCGSDEFVTDIHSLRSTIHFYLPDLHDTHQTTSGPRDVYQLDTYQPGTTDMHQSHMHHQSHMYQSDMYQTDMYQADMHQSDMYQTDTYQSDTCQSDTYQSGTKDTRPIPLNPSANFYHSMRFSLYYFIFGMICFYDILSSLFSPLPLYLFF